MACPALGLLAAALAATATRAPTLEDYRHFRAPSIDLRGRVPTRAELAQFEAPDFDLDAWIDQRLVEPAYAERMARIYMDVLRLQVGPRASSCPIFPRCAGFR